MAKFTLEEKLSAVKRYLEWQRKLYFNWEVNWNICKRSDELGKAI